MIHSVVIIPVFNNVKTIRRVVFCVKEICSQVIVINDGSTDGTSEILRTIDGVDLIEFDQNRGKGAALKAGFFRAQESGYSHAITFDADGQYMADEIPLFLQKIQENPLALWIGERSIPEKNGCRQSLRSRMVKLLTHHWYQLSTGISIKDTQCGFRVYPLKFIKDLQHKTGDRYEFEMEVLIFATWYHTPVKSLPIHVFYPTPEEYVTQFRPFRDSLRVFRLMGALFLPSGSGSKGFSWNGLVKFVRILIQRELKTNATPLKAAVSLAAGVFLAITPFHGLQVLLLLAATFIFKLNRPLAFLGVSISSAPFLPFWLAAGTAAGKIVLPDLVVSHISDYCKLFLHSFFLEKFQSFGTGFMHTFVQYFIGSILLAVVCGVLTLGVSFLMFRWRNSEQ